MKILLSTLASFAVTGGAIAPLTMTTNQSTITNKTTLEEPLKEVRIDLDGVKKISVDQGGNSWSIKFELGINAPMNIKKIKFSGGGLKSYVAWGSSVWEYGWPEIDVIANGNTNTIFKDDHTSGLAKHTAYLNYTLSERDFNEYQLKFDFFSQSYNSLTGSWGTLTIGDALIFSE